jgi:hypothetical protein
MKRNKPFPIGLIVIGVVILGFVALAVANYSQPESRLPMSVSNKYDAILQQYPDIFFLQMSQCQTDDSALYVVTEGHGYSGAHYYFDLSGNSLGSFEYDDMIEENEPAPPYDLSEYTCIVIKEKTYASE